MAEPATELQNPLDRSSRIWAVLTLLSGVVGFLGAAVVGAFLVVRGDLQARQIKVDRLWTAVQAYVDDSRSLDTASLESARKSMQDQHIAPSGMLYLSLTRGNSDGGTISATAKPSVGVVRREFVRSRAGAAPMTLVAHVHWRDSWLERLLELGLAYLLAFLAAGLLLGYVYVGVRRRLLDPERAAATALQRLAAVGRLAQMIAHDARKPLSMVRIFQQRVVALDSVAELHRVVRDFGPDLNQALLSIDGLIDDVLEISSTAIPDRQQISLRVLIEKSLLQVFRDGPVMDIHFEYRLEHARTINGDPGKLQRVLVNIVANAVQAMNGRGNIWFETREGIARGGRFTELVIGNSGSFVPESERERIFESFFTKDKLGGTGLGLAIARKVVSDHGGKIWCESDQEEGTKFCIHLPTNSAAMDWCGTTLPMKSHEISRAREMSMSDSIGTGDRPSAGSTGAGGEVFVVVLDDDPFILEAWTVAMKDAVVTTFRSPEEFMTKVALDPTWLGSLALIITDYHFGSLSKETGETLAKFVSGLSSLPIVLSSDLPLGTSQRSSHMTMQIGKDPRTLAEINRMLTIETTNLPASKIG